MDWQKILDKLDAQHFGPNDSMIASAVMHPQEALVRGLRKLGENIQTAGSPYSTPDEAVKAGLDIAGLAQTGALPFAPSGAGTLGTITKPKNLNEGLLAKYLKEGYLNYDDLAKYEKNALKMEKSGGQKFNVENAQANPNYEEYKSQFDTPFFHGTERIDRLLAKEGLDPKRATSGPMPYGTDSPEIASNYAKNKNDTSLFDNEDWNYANAYTVSPQQLGFRGSNPYTVEQTWYYLSPEQRQAILKNAPRVGKQDLEEWTGNMVLHPENVDAINKSHFDYLLKQNRNNPLAALREYWVDSGNLFNEESKLADIYKLSGYPHVISQDTAPWAEHKGILTGVSRITNPLDTSNTQELIDKVVPALRTAFKNDKTRLKVGVDAWDKNSRYTPKQWVDELENDVNAGKNSYVWTSIPDKVTQELKNLGYNGIYDTGGKMGGEGHQVTIPFMPSQIRSKFAAFDPLRQASPSLLASGLLGSLLLNQEMKREQ